MRIYCTCCWWWSGGLRAIRSTRVVLRPSHRMPTTLPHHLKKVRDVWDIVPHGIKENKWRAYYLGRGNAFALPPQTPNKGPLTRGPSKCRPPVTWRPTRVSAWTRVASCHVSTPCASRARAALPRGLACRVASAQVPRTTSASPTRHVSPTVLRIKQPLFRFF